MRQYEMVELSFTAQAPEGSEVEVDLRGTFFYGTEKVEVKGFYAGNDTYKVRFLPTQAGVYTYKITGIVSEEGQLEIAPAEVGKHGIVRADGTHLKFMDGSYFYSFGTTIYALAHQTKELMDETMDTLSKAPFNKVRMCVFPKHYQYNQNEPDYYAFHTLEGKTFENAKKKDFGMNVVMLEEALWDVHHPDFRFWDAFEARMKQLDDMGIIVDLILFHPYDRWGFSQMTREADLVYLDYLLRRFAAIPNLMWSMANEYDLFLKKDLDDWYAIEAYIAENDPYKHMLSNHNCFPAYDFGRENITHVSLQNRTVCRVPELQKEYGKPVFYDECAYEGNLEETFGSITGEEMSDRFWKVMVSGGYCTHGETFIDYSQENIDEAVVFWAKGGKLIGESPERIAFLRAFAESLPGPIDPVVGGFGRILSSSKEEIMGALNFVPEGLRPMVLAISKMDEKEKLYHSMSEFNYEGHVGEDVFINYYGADRHSRVTLRLPADKKYRVEVIDTWNMTRETMAEGQSGMCRIRVPEKQWLAVAAFVERD